MVWQRISATASRVAAPPHASGAGEEEEQGQGDRKKTVHNKGLPSTVFDKNHYPPNSAEKQEEISNSFGNKFVTKFGKLCCPTITLCKFSGRKGVKSAQTV